MKNFVFRENWFRSEVVMLIRKTETMLLSIMSL